MFKSYKRMLALLLSIIMIFSVMPSTVFAVSDDTEVIYAPIEFSITSVKGVANKTVHVEVRVTENSQIASLGLELLFDSSKLLVKDFASGELFENGLSAINANVSDKIIVSFASMEPITKAGTLFSVEFDVTTEEINDIIPMELNVLEATDINSDKLVASTNSGTVEVVDVLYGDVTFDNRITAVDALKILSAATEETVLNAEETKAGDVNGDGEVSVSDALQILYFSAEIVTDFRIYNLENPQNLKITNLDGYQFTAEWDWQKDVIGYNVYLDGVLLNEELLTENSVSIGVNMNGEYGCSLIPNRIHDKIEQVTTYNLEITAVNALKETDKSHISVTTKRIWSWVTFVDWDGRIINKSRVYYGDDAVVPNNPTRPDYFFIGWDKATTNILDDTVITATYEDAHYNFIFRNEDGTELYRQDVTVNGKATPPASPTKTGYTFSGWYTSATGGSKVTDFTITSATGERTVYAQYTINSYTVTFNSNGGSAVGSKTAVYKATVSAPSNPTRLGYGFGGWYKDKNCTNKWNFSLDVVTSNTTLYAKWVPVVITIDKPEITLNGKNKTEKLTATVTGGTDSITWSSSNPNVATVDANGVVTAVGHGTATIFVKGVSSERKPVTKITVNIAKDAWVNADVGLNLRAEPTSYSASLKLIPYRTKITVYGDIISGSDGRTDWIAASYDGYDGYVAAEYLLETEPKEKTPTNTYTPGSESALTGTLEQNLAKLEKNVFLSGYYWRGTVDDMKNISDSPYAPNGECYPGDGVCTGGEYGYCSHNYGYCTGYGCHRCGIYRVDGITRLSCAGYASTIFYCLYGKDLYNYWISPSSGVKAGDVMVWNTGGWGEHWIFVTKVYKSNGVTYIEYTDANGGGTEFGNCNKIQWHATKPLNEISIKALYRA